MLEFTQLFGEPLEEDTGLPQKFAFIAADGQQKEAASIEDREEDGAWGWKGSIYDIGVGKEEWQEVVQAAYNEELNVIELLPFEVD